jgi:hypothetical protein
MPFKSQAQRRFMHAEHPELAEEFEAATPKGAKLPEHVGKGAEEKHRRFMELHRRPGRTSPSR